MTRPGRFIRAYPRTSAGGVDYDGSGSGLDADNVQDAIDELADASGAIAVTDDTTVVDPATEVEFDPEFFDVIDEGGGVARVTATFGRPIGPLLLASDHGNPITFDDIFQASDGNDLLYASEP